MARSTIQSFNQPLLQVFKHRRCPATPPIIFVKVQYPFSLFGAQPARIVVFENDDDNAADDDDDDDDDDDHDHDDDDDDHDDNDGR